MADASYARRGATTAARTTAARAGAPAARPSLAMSADDHGALVELLLQQTAHAAGRAAAIGEPGPRLRASGEAVGHARRALAACALPDAALAARRLSAPLDGALHALHALHDRLRGDRDPAAAGAADAVAGALAALAARFAAAGWQPPRSEPDRRARAHAAAGAGATTLDAGEAAVLGRLHVRAARQILLAGWADAAAGRLDAVIAGAADQLRAAFALLVDPQVGDAPGELAGELAATEQVAGRLVLALERDHPPALAGLRELARGLDALLALTGQPARWGPRLAAPAAAPAGSAGPAGPAGALASISNDVDRGAPRGEPPMHRIVESRVWTKKVHLRDTNYRDEYLGYVELTMEAYRTASGQVYVQRAKATKMLDDRAQEYLTMGADVVAASVEHGGRRYSDVYFDVQIGGPNKTETTAVAFGAKAVGSNGDKSLAAEASAGVVFSTAVTSQGTRSFRRVYRITGLDQPITLHQLEPGPPFQLRQVATQLVETERVDQHLDFAGFELDDDDVGDRPWTFYANWVLESYSD